MPHLYQSSSECRAALNRIGYEKGLIETTSFLHEYCRHIFLLRRVELHLKHEFCALFDGILSFGIVKRLLSAAKNRRLGYRQMGLV